MKIDKNILITGGAGFIGSNITEFLLNNNVKFIRIFDNLSTGKKDNIQFLLDKFPNLEFNYGSITNLEDCRKAMKDIDIVCHQAALGSVPRSVNDPLSSHQNNVNGFFNILLSAKEEGIKRIVYASSSSVYGDNPILPKVEENTGNVLSPYAATKAIDEIYVCGGGIKNQTLISNLESLFKIKIRSSKEIDLDPMLVESAAFGWLAKKRLHHEALQVSSKGKSSKGLLGSITKIR